MKVSKSMVAGDVMITKTVTLSPETHVCDGLACLLKHHISGAPVIGRHQEYLGVFSEKRCMGVFRLAAAIALEKERSRLATVRAKELMATRLVTLSPKMDICDAIGVLLKNRISGAPVLDKNGKFMGVLSERYSMWFLLEAAYEQQPTSNVGPLMNTDFGRVIDADLGLTDVADIFLHQHYRRLIVLDREKPIGLISRRDVLRAGQGLVNVLRNYKLNSPALLQSSDDSEIGGKSVPDAMNAALEKLKPPIVGSFMDKEAQTIEEDTDLLSIAQIFHNTNCRRLPVLRDGKLIGQLSRRDVLKAIYDEVAIAPSRTAALLYLSSIVGPGDVPFSR